MKVCISPCRSARVGGAHAFTPPHSSGFHPAAAAITETELASGLIKAASDIYVGLSVLNASKVFSSMQLKSDVGVEFAPSPSDLLPIIANTTQVLENSIGIANSTIMADLRALVTREPVNVTEIGRRVVLAARVMGITIPCIINHPPQRTTVSCDWAVAWCSWINWQARSTKASLPISHWSTLLHTRYVVGPLSINSTLFYTVLHGTGFGESVGSCKYYSVVGRSFNLFTYQCQCCISCWGWSCCKGVWLMCVYCIGIDKLYLCENPRTHSHHLPTRPANMPQHYDMEQHLCRCPRSMQHLNRRGASQQIHRQYVGVFVSFIYTTYACCACQTTSGKHRPQALQLLPQCRSLQHILYCKV